MKNIIKNIISISISLIDNLMIIFISRINSEEYDLLVKVDAIGDFIVWLPYAWHYLKFNKNKKTILICNESLKEVAEKINLFDQLIYINTFKFKRNIFYRYKILLIMKSYKFNNAIQTTFSRDFLVGDSLIKFSSANKKIGYKGDLINQTFSQKIVSDRWYTKLIDNPNLNTEIERNQEFIKFLCPGIAFRYKSIPKLIKLKKSLLFKRPYIIIFPGASNYKRMWPIDKFSILIKYLIKEFDFDILLCGSKNELFLCKEIEKEVGKRNLINISGKTSLLEFIEIVRNAKLLIGNETSAVHIAAAVDIQSICILGGGHYGRFVPYPSSYPLKAPIPIFNKMECYNCNWKCNLKHSKNKAFPCISEVEAEQVINVVQDIID